MQKTVLKVNINCMKCQTEVLKTVAKLEGIDEIAVDIAKGTLTVIGVVDPVQVAKKLRKSGKMAEVVSVGPPKKEPDEEKVDDIKDSFPSCCKECELGGGFELKQKVDLALNKLADGDTCHIGVDELQKLAQCLTPEGFASFLSCILDTDKEKEQKQKKSPGEGVRLIVTLMSFQRA
ncbi:hypothetical protein NC651_039262 [Populus alba x Populus x berolinensis]|nr:hypothetical protein NC651_039262 [Populus alba x Populus x berolinensis]